MKIPAPADLDERYRITNRHNATDAAPWYVVPADRKWFTRLIVSSVIIDAIESVEPRYPDVDPKVRGEFKRLAADLEAERRPKGGKK